ncbi:type VII secretion-associated serine protease mycosin [Kitasatospora sp. NPDC096147]|uniref:type VII secretion-associated serine protease mycosin n=1 Tax=Kitasatospora sp. NPDC096147 TaxID=3364093 RepID=UPI00381FD36A
MRFNRKARGAAALTLGAILWGTAAFPATADNIREAQWPIDKFDMAKKVWPITQGEGVTVAVIDTGVLPDHQDLVGQVLPGADFTGQQSDGRIDPDGHGTGLASLIAGHGNGGENGIIGLAPKAKILPVRINLGGTDKTVGANADEVPKAIRFAVDNGAKVINMSFGSGIDTGIRDAIKYAADKDVVLVAAAGNLAHHDTPVEYPAAAPGVVAVGAVDKDGKVWEKSNRGPEITLMAPGVDIYSAGPKAKAPGDYHKANGTSDSSAFVAATAALIRSKYPELSAGQVINRMIKSAVVPAGEKLPNSSYGYGIASPSKALAPNPEVDSGPRENPLLARPESQRSAAPSAPAASAPAPTPGGQAAASPEAKKDDDGGIPVFVWAVVGLLAVVVVGGVIVLARRGGGGRGGQPPQGGGGGQVYPPQPQGPYGGGQQYPQQQYPPQQQYQQPQQPQQYPPQPGQGGYPPPPQQGTGGGGNPYR